jgi:hypothetical protein
MARREIKGSSVFVVLAVVVFGGVVFLLFRGHSTGPQEAVAGDVPPVSSPAETAGDAMPAAPTEAPVEAVPLSSLGLNQPTETAPGPVETVEPQDPAIDAALAEAVGVARTQPGEIIQTRNKLNKLLQGRISPEQRQTVKDEMAKLSKDWLFGPAAFPGDMLCDTYTVRRGDLLEILGRRMKIPYEILMQINNIPRPQALQAGRALKMIHGPFHAKVSRSTFMLDLYLQDMYVRSFKVGLGKPGCETPTGLWRVQEYGKLVKPPWTDPDTGRLYKSTDPDYPLGSRWIGLDGLEGLAKGRTGFAIHGTKEPEQIGTAGSRGCIRMYNDEAVLMYNLLIPVYSQVEVVD